MASDENSCNLTVYSEWHHGQLEDDQHLPTSLHQLRIDLLQVQRSDAEVWRVMNFDEEHEDFISLYSGRRPMSLNITKGQAMEVSSVWCNDAIQEINKISAGGHGPPSNYLTADYAGDYLITIHDTMCSSYCLTSDYLREEAIATSRCNCIELSTDKNYMSYTKEGDFCLKNSGHLLCQNIDLHVCEKCELKNFTCPRKEYDVMQDVPLRGYGNECSGCEIMLSHSSLLLEFACLAITALSLL